MSFTIHSIGDSEFLEQILISVAMISGTGDIAKLAMVGGVLGVIFVMVQSLFQGAKQINFQHILLGWILYASLFGPTTTVLIEDSYSGHVKVVDNVPFSVGVAGGVISSVGYGLKNLFEQGFGVISPGETSRRYTEALELLNDLHRASNNAATFDVINEQIGPGADFRKSWQNYITDCTLAKIDLGEQTADYIAHAPISKALKFESNIYHTEIYLPSPEILSCTQAFNKLDGITGNYADGSNAAVREAMNKIMGFDLATQVHGAIPPMDKANASIQSLFQFTNDSYSFVKTAMLEPIYMEAVAGRYQDVRDYSAAVMINQAISQRNFQWASEQSMFMTVARPLMAFFEGFIYAVTPVMAFLVMLGSVGLTLAMKYMQSLLWIQLWMPTLAVVNLYINSAASSELMAKVGYSSDNLGSMYGLNTAVDIISSWIATGGMLAAATPVISMFFVTGSSYAFANIAQRVGGDDHIDEKLMSPDIAKVGSVMAMDNAYKADTVTGPIAGGSEQFIDDLQLGGQALNSAISSAKALQNTKSQAFAKELAKQYLHAKQHGKAAAYEEALGRSLAASKDSSFSSSVEARRDKLMSDGLSEEQAYRKIGQEALTHTAGAEISVGAEVSTPFAFLGAKASASTRASTKVETSGSTADQETVGQGKNRSTGDSHGDANGFADVDQATLSTQIATNFGDSYKETWGDTKTASNSEAYKQSSAELLAASQQYNELSQFSQSSGSGLTLKAHSLGANLNSEAITELNSAMKVAPKAVRDHASKLALQYGNWMPDQNMAQNYANLVALQTAGNYNGDHGAFVNGYNNYLAVASKALGRDFAKAGDASANSNLKTPQVVTGSAEKPNEREIEQKLGERPLDPAAVNRAAAASRNEVEGRATKENEKATEEARVYYEGLLTAGQSAKYQSLVPSKGDLHDAIDAAKGNGADFDAIRHSAMNDLWLTPAQADLYAAVATGDKDRYSAAYEALSHENIRTTRRTANPYALTNGMANSITSSVLQAQKGNAKGAMDSLHNLQQYNRSTADIQKGFTKKALVGEPGTITPSGDIHLDVNIPQNDLGSGHKDGKFL